MSVLGTKYDFDFILIQRKGLIEDIIKLRKKWKISAQGHEDQKSHEDWLRKLAKDTDRFKGRDSKKAPLNAFNIDMEELINEYDLPIQYKEPVKTFLFWDEVEQPSNFRITKNIEEGKERLFIEVFPHTTTKDIQKEWGLVQLQQGIIWGIKKKKRNKPNMNDKINKMVAKLKRKGLSGPEIASEVNKKYRGNKMTGKKVNSIISKIRNNPV